MFQKVVVAIFGISVLKKYQKMETQKCFQAF